MDEDDYPPDGRSLRRREVVFSRSFDPENPDVDVPVSIEKTPAQQHLLESNMRQLFLFGGLEFEQLHKVIDGMVRVEVDPGLELLKEGEDAHYFFVVESGQFEKSYVVNGEEQKVSVYDNCGCFGALALLYSQPQTETVRAITSGVVWALNRESYKKIMVSIDYNNWKMYETLFNTVPLLKNLTVDDLRKLGDVLVENTFKNGECITRQNDIVNGLYLIVSGQVRLIATNDTTNRQVSVTLLKEGQYFGDLPENPKHFWDASAYAEGEVKLAYLEAKTVKRLVRTEFQEQNAAAN